MIPNFILWAHSAHSTIVVCEELFPGFWGKDIWLPNSPDLKKILRTRYTTVNAIKAALTSAWDEITVETCTSVIGNIRKRLRKSIEAQGGNFEHLL